MDDRAQAGCWEPSNSSVPQIGDVIAPILRDPATGGPLLEVTALNLNDAQRWVALGHWSIARRAHSPSEHLETLQQIAAVAHCGGWANMSDSAALLLIRRLTMSFFDERRQDKFWEDKLRLAIKKIGK